MWQLVAPPAGSLITPYVRGLLGVGARGRGEWVGARGRAGCVWFHRFCVLAVRGLVSGGMALHVCSWTSDTTCSKG